MLKIFFDISTGFRFSKISVECSVHLCSCPWISHRSRFIPLMFKSELPSPDYTEASEAAEAASYLVWSVISL